MLITWLIGTFAACGVVWLFGLLLDVLLLPLPRNDALHVCFLRGDTAQAEHCCKVCLRRWRGRVVCFVDDGLQPEARKAVLLLLRRRDAVYLCSRVQLAEYVLGEHKDWKMN